MTKVELMLKEGRFMKRVITEVDLGSQDQMLQSLTEVAPMMLPSLTSYGSMHMHLLVGKTQAAACVELKQLPFSTWWGFFNGTLRPMFYQERGYVKIDEPWPVPAEFGKCLFTLLLSRNGSRFVSVNAYLFFYKNGELHRIYYPNIFEDGRICMGAEWDAQRGSGTTLMDEFSRAYTSFHTTEMNKDLVKVMTYETFRRDLTGWIAPADRMTHLVQTAPAFMNGFAL